jgi:Ty3 transposon capsid-like protein
MQKKWFTKTEPGYSGRFLKEEDFSAKEEEPQIKQETPELPKLTFFDDNNLYTDMANTGREIKIRAPSNFTRDRTKTMKFLQEVTLFLQVNKAIYDTNKKKIIFSLSFMNGGMASVWALEQGNREWLGTWQGFVTEVKEAFPPIDNAGSAWMEIKTLKQGDNLEDYINQFFILKTRSGLTKDTALIEYFVDGLKPALLDKIFTMENIPNTLNGVIKAVAKYDGNWRRAKAIAGRAWETHEKKTATAPKTMKSTLEINCLSQQERNKHMQKGLCFICHSLGHRASDHKHGNFPLPDQTNRHRYLPPELMNCFIPKRKGIKAYVNIKAILGDLDKEEKGKALTLMEEAGF